MCIHISTIPCGCPTEPIDLADTFGNPLDGSDDGVIQRVWAIFTRGQLDELVAQADEFLSGVDVTSASQRTRAFAMHVLDTLGHMAGLFDVMTLALNQQRDLPACDQRLFSIRPQ